MATKNNKYFWGLKTFHVTLLHENVWLYERMMGVIWNRSGLRPDSSISVNIYITQYHTYPYFMWGKEHKPYYAYMECYSLVFCLLLGSIERCKRDVKQRRNFVASNSITTILYSSKLNLYVWNSILCFIYSYNEITLESVEDGNERTVTRYLNCVVYMKWME